MRLCRCIFTLSVSLIWSSLSFAQDQPATQDRSAGTRSVKQVKKRQKELYKELGPQDKVWLDEEVADIITPQEREAFLELSTSEEREQFRESFWDRHNPDRESPINTAKEDHYRRLAYADEHFSSGILGRKTDRGRIYIIWGPPDEIDSHPTGGTYDRPIDQAEGNPPLTLGKCGAIATWRALAKISKSSLLTPPAPANIALPWILVKKTLSLTSPEQD
jgi:GWxTD domain-containing protein